jgi:hypothetical protein
MQLRDGERASFVIDMKSPRSAQLRPIAQYRPNRARAMPHNLATATKRTICTTEVRADGARLETVPRHSMRG